MKRIIFSFFFLLFTLLFTNCKNSEKNNSKGKEISSEVPFSVLSEGNNGGFEQDTLLLIRSSEEMQAGWKKLFSNFVEQPDMPSVHFANQMVVILSMGEKNNGGYSIEVSKVVEKELQLAVFANYISPGQNCIVAEVISYPFVVISIPKKDKLVAISKNNVIAECK